MAPGKPDEHKDVEAELEEAVQKILQSTSQRRLVVAGPGTGKTTLFKKLLEASIGDKNSRLVLTFITNLRDELEESLSGLAKVSTLHGYCQSLLRNKPELRNGLSANFVCQPELASLIKRDWSYSHKGEAPHFVDSMRHLAKEDEVQFYFTRANYYDAVDFDDSVYRTCIALRNNPKSVPNYDLVLVDEYQDFNLMEADLINTLATLNPIVLAGDDDQALYSQLRGASWDHIRLLHNESDYEVFQLPFCMRCPEVVVDAVSDVIAEACCLRKLEGRIDKPYRHYAPAKGSDSKLYPKIWLIETTVQRKNANYFGRFIEKAIKAIPSNEIREANDKREPVVLIIGSKQYLRQIEDHLKDIGLTFDAGSAHEEPLCITRGLSLLKKNTESNLGWRIILEFKDKHLAASCVERAATEFPLIEVIPREFKESVLSEVENWSDAGANENDRPDGNSEGLTIKLTSFQGAKGLSAQHVFIVGLQAGDLPRDHENIEDLEICKFLVGLTRTKKRCALMWTKNFANKWKEPSIFLKWIRSDRYDAVNVDAKYWK